VYLSAEAYVGKVISDIVFIFHGKKLGKKLEILTSGCYDGSMTFLKETRTFSIQPGEISRDFKI
jgi:hypothetical protein